MLLEKRVDSITINDFDRSIYAFWHSVLNETKDLCALIKDTEINIKNRLALKALQGNKEQTDLLQLGFSTFFLNRVNRSGIINAGVIGGNEQEGNYKMDCRFNKEALIEKIHNIAKHKNKIKLCNEDALELLKKVRGSQTMLYLDPPYYEKGATLYMNHYTEKQHAEIATAMKKLKKAHWIVSYDNEPPIKKMYNWAKSRKYNLKHHAYKVRQGKEILFYSESLKINNKLLPN